MTAATSRGTRWAVKVREEYDLHDAADALVGEIVRLLDRADALQTTIDALASLVVETSSGPRIHPAVTEYRSTFAALQRALASLGLDKVAIPPPPERDEFDDLLDGTDH